MENNGQVVHADERTFKDVVLDAKEPCLVDFWAPWCGPCRAIGPLLEEIAKEYEGRVRVVKVNVDESPGLAGGYGIRSIPSLLFIRGGRG